MGYDDDLIQRLQESKPDSIEQTEWTKNQRMLAQRFSAQLYDQSLLRDSPFAYIKAQNLSVLPKEMSDDLISKVYRIELRNSPVLFIKENAERFLKNPKPIWMTDEDYSNSKAEAERVIGIAKKDVLYHLLKSILWNAPLPKDQVECLEPELRKELINMEKEIRLAKEKNQTDDERISKDSQQLERDKKIILRQLSILEKLFIDASSISRIESYDNPFAAGNLELLRKVAEHLQSGETA